VGIDLCEALRTSTLAKIKSALLESSVLFLGNQPIDQNRNFRLAAQFGTIEEPRLIFD
jgi:alpha-ketoglutarate-dependent taurine dioxygenase